MKANHKEPACATIPKLTEENGNSVDPDNSPTVLFGHLSTKKISCRKKQDRSQKRNQDPSRVCFGYDRNLLVPLMLVIVASLMMFVVVGPPMVAPIVIVVGICQCGKSD